MSKEMTIIALGIWVIIIPYLGVPGPWRNGVLIITGVGIVLAGFSLRARAFSRGTKSTAQHPFVENSAPPAESPSSDHDRKERINSLN